MRYYIQKYISNAKNRISVKRNILTPGRFFVHNDNNKTLIPVIHSKSSTSFMKFFCYADH